MMVAVEITSYILQLFISQEHKIGALIIVIISVVVGMLIYASFTMKNRLADEFLGDIPNKIRRKLGIAS